MGPACLLDHSLDKVYCICTVHYAFACLLLQYVYPQVVGKELGNVLLYNPNSIASLFYNVAHLAGNTYFSLGWVCYMHVKTTYKPYKFISYSCLPILRSVLILTCHVYQCVFHSGLLTRIFYEFVVSPIQATCPVYLILDLITLIISGETYNFETLLCFMHQDLLYTAT
jgi:hypothetical protein